jgi:hypothetical protein
MNLDYLLSSVTETNFDSVGGNCEPGERRIDESKVIDAAIHCAGSFGGGLTSGHRGSAIPRILDAYVLDVAQFAIAVALPFNGRPQFSVIR